MRYVVKSAWDENKWIVESGSPHPDRIIGPMVDGEDPEWLQIEMIDNGLGNMISALTVDELKKKQVLQKRLDDQLIKSKDRDQKDAVKKSKKDALRLFKKSNINSLDDIKNSLEDIIELLKEQDIA